jgi:hypothetical protein
MRSILWHLLFALVVFLPSLALAQVSQDDSDDETLIARSVLHDSQFQQQIKKLEDYQVFFMDGSRVQVQSFKSGDRNHDAMEFSLISSLESRR